VPSICTASPPSVKTVTVEKETTPASCVTAVDTLGGALATLAGARQQVMQGDVADPEYLADVTPLWKQYNTVHTYLDRLEAARGSLDPEVKDELDNQFDRVRDLRAYPFEVVELDAAMDEEAVAEVFVRINSEGVTLNQADFILTLMSVSATKRASSSRSSPGRRRDRPSAEQAPSTGTSSHSPTSSCVSPSPYPSAERSSNTPMRSCAARTWRRRVLP
jgi:hypothetical protein